MKPVILLVGCGQFGQHHLRILQELAEADKIILKGVITARAETRQRIAEEHRVDVFSELNSELLASVDAVDITTPAGTHFSIIKKCIKYTNILVEKPLALSTEEMKEIKKLSEKYKKIVMVGHVFRFNHGIKKLKEIVSQNINNLQQIEGKFVGKGLPEKDCGAITTLLHLFDVLEYILEKNPVSVKCEVSRSLKGEFEDYASIMMDYGKYYANLEIGWVDKDKERSLLFKFRDMNVYCDILRQVITIDGETIECFKEEPLKMEIKYFLTLLDKTNNDYPDIDTAIKIQKVVDAAYESDRIKDMVGVE